MNKDLQEIKRLAAEKEDENWQFRSWLKFHSPSNIDSTVKKLSQKYSALIDCKECANCCRSLNIVLDSKVTKQFAAILDSPVDEFQKQYTFVDEEKDRLLKAPCPVLKSNLCTIYENRPDTCRTFPHLEKSSFLGRLFGVIGSLSVCPIAFNTFEELKAVSKWKKH